MKTESTSRSNRKASIDEKENIKNTRKTLKIIQESAIDKENLVGRSKSVKDTKLAANSTGGTFKAKKPVILVDKGVQTGETVITAADLISDEPGIDYWKTLAEQRKVALDESLEENGRLKDVIESLEEENKICKEMLNEAKELVAVLQEMMDDRDENTEDFEVES
ncbi:geminin [Agrilus planipennis]|uniref:Geminin n=1 Tax=Agrilus planipennis TaxID=224129 RepID=A0A1W4W584_AGRPL|nr:geminin [Agrilus planipennis]